MHTDKFEEFKKNFTEFKKTAVVKDSGTKEEVKGQMPAKIEDKLPEPSIGCSLRLTWKRSRPFFRRSIVLKYTRCLIITVFTLTTMGL